MQSHQYKDRSQPLCCCIGETNIPSVPHLYYLCLYTFSLSWNNIEHKLVSALRQCLTISGLEGIPEGKIMEVIILSCTLEIVAWFGNSLVLQYLCWC